VKRWWLRPAVRVGAALLLPLVVPFVITLLIWALPGDPASIICPPESCGGTQALAQRWNLDGGAMQFYTGWMGDVLSGELGNSWRLQQGVPVKELFAEAVPNTMLLILLALGFVSLGGVGAATGLLPEGLDPILRILGLVPAVVLALVAAAVVEYHFGADSFSTTARWIRLGAGAVVLGLADGAFANAAVGTRELFQTENRQRYVGIAILRGERVLSNTLPNVSPALAGQFRARTLHLLSGAVIVEVILRIDGMGDLLWGGTLMQDFGVVLASATGFAMLSAGLLILQAMIEIAVALHVRRTPAFMAGGEAA